MLTVPLEAFVWQLRLLAIVQPTGKILFQPSRHARMARVLI